MISSENIRNVLLTFDYELFLGERSGTVENCVITPTRHLLQILSKHKAKSIFFIDTLYLFRLRQEGLIHSSAKKDYDKIKEQLSQLTNEGHYLFHHVHPHWLDAVYLPDSNQWQELDYTRFAVSSLNDEERNRVFALSKSELEQIVPGSGSLATGFRAGGLYFQPFTVFMDGFHQAGIKYDFSVLPGFKSEEKFHKFDFSNVEEKTPYRFNSDTLMPEKDGLFMEFPISTSENTGLWKIMNSLWYRVITKNFSSIKWGDGLPTSNKIFPVRKNSFFKTTETFSVENLSPVRSLKYQNYLKHHSYLHVISHPKLISKSQAQVLDKFLEVICRRYHVEFDFMKFATAK